MTKERPGRVINVNGKIWKYRIGRSNIVAYSGEQKKCEKIWLVKGITAEAFEKGRYKKTSDGTLFPREIEQWLKK